MKIINNNDFVIFIVEFCIAMYINCVAGGLQKSMPNLAASKSCDINALKSEVMSASTSEKGSYGDIPANSISSNPSGSSSALANGHKQTTSRLPTPRSRLPTPARQVTTKTSRIPINRAK